MARRLRIQFRGGLYHITTRGNEKKNIFRDDKDRIHYIRVLDRYKEELKFRLYSYVLMPNHTHLLIETPLGNIAKIMFCVNTNYATYFNRRYDRVGHVFQGRYKSIIVDKESHLLELIRYIHLNPVRAGIVKRPDDYRWGSHRKYLDGVDRTGLVSVRTVLSHFGGSTEKTVEQYRDFVDSGVGYIEVKDGQFIGRNAFIEDLTHRMGLSEEQIGGADTDEGRIGLDRIIDVVSEESGLSATEIRSSRRRCAVRVRNIAIWLARRLSGKTLAEIGTYFGGITPQAASQATDKTEENRKLKKISEKYLAKIEG